MERFVAISGQHISSLYSFRTTLPPPPRRNLLSPSRILCSASPPPSVDDDGAKETKEYKAGVLDDLFLAFFRKKMAEDSLLNINNYHVYRYWEVDWDSEKPGYDGLIEVANCLMVKGKTSLGTSESAVRVLKSLFPPFLPELFKMLIAPIGGGKAASVLVARATAFSCQWLMGPCSVNSVHLPDGSTINSGVFVQRCKYLEESKCVGICTSTCKQPTQTFFKDYMGVQLTMEPNFTDFSCQFKFGVPPLQTAEDKLLMEPCLSICPNASRRRERVASSDVEHCPQV